jgi:hypothetical protein
LRLSRGTVSGTNKISLVLHSDRLDPSNGFVLFTALYVVIIFYKEDFSYYDEDQLTDFSLQGRMLPTWIMGRFVPIWLQEFNA